MFQCEGNKKSRIREWSGETFAEFDEDMRRMEAEIISYRRKTPAYLGQSSFSYYLYEKKVHEMQTRWHELVDCRLFLVRNLVQWEELEALVLQRLGEIEKQNSITLEEYPKEAEFLQLQKEHGKCCAKWKRYMDERGFE